MGLLTESVAEGAASSEANLLAIEVRFGLAEGALTTVAGVLTGAVVVAVVELCVDLFVIEEEDINGPERLVNVTGVFESSVAVGVGVDLMVTLEAAVESELSLTEGVVKVEDLVNVVMIVLGLAMGEEDGAVFVRGLKYWLDAVVGKQGFTVAAVLTEVEVSGEEMVGLEKKEEDDGVTSLTAAVMALLAFPHSASTSAMKSPPPEIESKVRREEMSASKELRLLSPGTMGG